MFFCTVLCLATEKTKGQKENQADDFNSSAQRIPHCGLPIGISLFQLCSFTFSATKWTLTIFFFLIFFLLHLLLLFSLKEMGKCSNRAFWLNQWAHTSKPAGTSNPYRWIRKKRYRLLWWEYEQCFISSVPRKYINSIRNKIWDLSVLYKWTTAKWLPFEERWWGKLFQSSGFELLTKTKGFKYPWFWSLIRVPVSYGEVW